MEGPIDVNRKGNKTIGGLAKNMTLTSDHTHGFDRGFSWSSFEIAVSQELEARLTLNKTNGSRSFMTMTVTLWWPRWDVKVTSDFGEPSTRLIFFFFIYSRISFWC